MNTMNNIYILLSPQPPCVRFEQPGPSKSTYRAPLLGLNLFQFLIEPTLLYSAS